LHSDGRPRKDVVRKSGGEYFRSRILFFVWSTRRADQLKLVVISIAIKARVIQAGREQTFAFQVTPCPLGIVRCDFARVIQAATVKREPLAYVSPHAKCQRDRNDHDRADSHPE
jgi:hypothetical protein